ncbi:SDR family oxidoreductase [Bacillus halotolerans]|uniref:SDR family oxidoreductase n=1 Tax=Bacillus halotolerans TaxID=260554 RepID=UPI000D0409FC|nr:NAD(P)H-binding protein [Bacillus halotolerans]PRS03222.1 hydroxylase [Bacillus halotolerans]PRS19905.1 hydroxylase [Bacillus halotolerans]QKS03318.1 NAD(P)H-binding protein [Bacillus halotolerans]
MTILVTGATGTVGGHIVELLNGKGVKVKALTRAINKTNLPAEVQLVSGDLDHPETLQSHLYKVDGLFLMTQSDQSDTKFLANQRIVQMAEKAGVKKIVALVDYEGNPIEEVIKNSGMEWTILRPVEFMKNVLNDWAESIQKEGIIRTAFPDSLSARIHEADIAAVAVKSLTEEGHHKQTYDLTGPEALNPRNMLKQISEVIQKPIELIEMTVDEVKTEWKSKGYDEQFIDYFIIEMGKNPPEQVYTVLPTVERVLGEPARTFAPWVEENRHHFE